MNAQQISKMELDAVLTINDIEEIHNEIGIRKAIREGKLETQLVPIAPNSKTNRRIFTVEAYLNWRAGVGSNKGARSDGRNKYLLYVNDAELEEVKKLLEGTEYVGLIKRANKTAEAE